MYAEERQQAIASLVISKGRASVAELAQTYDVTTETVRRDLAALDRAGVLRRVHGGAVPTRALHLVEPGVGERESTRADHKDAIAAAAADFFPHQRRRACCWTPAPRRRGSRPAAHRPRPHRRHQLGAHRRAAGRRCRRSRCNCSAAGSGVSPRPPSANRRCACSTPFASTSPSSAPTASARGTDCPPPTARRPRVKRAMVACANYVVVAADSTKVGREDFVSFAPISSVDTLITDTEITDADRRDLTDARRRGHRDGSPRP